MPVIQSEEQRSEIVSEYPLLQAEQIPIPSVPPVILRRRNGQVTEFLLPAAFIGTKCSGVQPLVLGFSQSITCSPEFSSFSESECRSHEFLSASSLFASPLISSLGNVTVETPLGSNSSLLEPRWNESQCQNVLQEVSMLISLNRTLIVRAELSSIVYSNLTTQNYSAFSQTFTVKFENVLDPAEGEKKRGYERGEKIYALKVETEAPFLFAVPLPGVCGEGSMVPVRFLVNTTSACTIRASQCAEAQQIIGRLVDEFRPNWILSSPGSTTTVNETNALVIQRNLSGSEVPSASTCSLTTDVLVVVYHASEGAVRNKRQVIVSATYSTTTDSVSLGPNSRLVVRFSVQFRDSTPRISTRFAALPHIDLRLPNDFFYPFLERSAKAAFSLNAVPVLAFLSLLQTHWYTSIN